MCESKNARYSLEVQLGYARVNWGHGLVRVSRGNEPMCVCVLESQILGLLTIGYSNTGYLNAEKEENPVAAQPWR